MSTQIDNQTIPTVRNRAAVRGLSTVPLSAALVVSAISALVIAGWSFDIDFLKRLIPGYVFMNPATALAFVLSSVALCLLQSQNTGLIRLARICATVVSLVGLIKLCELIGFFDLGIDRILFRDYLFDTVTGKSNRMAPNTALSFFLLGAALLFNKVNTKKNTFYPVQILAVLVILTSFMAIIGYLYGATSFYLIVSFNPMAIHTALSFLLLAGGLLLSNPERGIIKEILSPYPGGQAARRLFPLFVLVPLILGWMRLYGEKKGFYGAEAGTAILIVAIIIILSAIVIFNARLTNRAAVKLGQTEDALNEKSKLLGLLSESEENYRQLADSMPQIVWTARPDGFLDYYNQRWFDYTGIKPEKTESWEAVLHPDDLQNFNDAWSKSVETGEKYNIEYRLKRVSDGAYHWHLRQALPVRNAENRIVKWFGTCTDIHEQKKVEKELRQIREELELRVEERTSELSAVAATLAEEIEERKIVQENMRVREERFQLATQATSDVVWDWDLTTDNIWWNQNFQTMFGYSENEIETNISYWTERLHPDDLKRIDRSIHKCIEHEEQSWANEYRFRRRDGSYAFIADRGHIVYDESGKPLRMIGSMMDITERRLVEEALRESELKFRSVTQSANDAIIAADSQGNIISWNNGAETIFGYLEAEVLSKSLTVLMPEFYREAHREGLKRHVKTGESHVLGKTVELQGLRKDASQFPLELSITSWTAGTEKFYSGIIRDISERKSAEEALEKAAKRERAIIDNALDVICTIDAEGRFVSVNRACLQMWGYQPEELVGRLFIDYVAPEDRAKTIAQDASIVSGNETANFENRYIHKNGTLVHVRWTAYWSDSEKLVFCVAHDITVRKQAEEDLKDFAAKLERSNNELQEFASIASHDLQEPLRKVQAFGDRLKAKCGDALSEDGRDYLERMQNAAGRMQTLINDLLTFSRVSTQVQPFLPLNLRQVVNEVLSDLETRIETTNATIEIGELATIEADPMQMRQLLQNLISNALKFNRPGVAPVVKISGQICHKTAAENEETNAVDTFHLTVEDNGIGFEEKHNDRIFKIFQRLHGRSEYEGTGIGLAVCRKIAKRHGGNITASSVPNEGAIFTVILPLIQKGITP